MMQVQKEKLIEKIESISNKLGKQVPILATDLTDVVLFLSIYGGNAPVSMEQILIKICGFNSPKEINNFNKNGQEKKVKREGDEATKYVAKSYDGSISLEFVVSKQYLKIEKTFDDFSNYYLSEYIFDGKGNFVRRAKQRSHPLEKQLEFFEESEGNLKRGVCFSNITENSQSLDVKFIKVLTSKGEELYYSYKASPEFIFAFRVPKIISSVPSITSLGMKALNAILEMQCENKFVKLDEKLFKELSKSAREIYEAQKKSTK